MFDNNALWFSKNTFSAQVIDRGREKSGEKEQRGRKNNDRVLRNINTIRGGALLCRYLRRGGDIERRRSLILRIGKHTGNDLFRKGLQVLFAFQ